MQQRAVLCIVGPTSSGKSDLAIEVAERLDGEILSADSMQIYKHMDIGTAKIDISNCRIKHYGIDIVDPSQSYSAALFQQYGRTAIDGIYRKGKLPIICGGTGFYIRAVIDDYCFAEGEQEGNPVRDRYNELLSLHGADYVWNELNDKDSASAQIIHPNDSKRVIRALELAEIGESYADRQRGLQAIESYYPSILIGIDIDRTRLRKRIDMRVDKMVSDGLVDEVCSLLNQGYRDAITSIQAIGYKEVIDAIDGKCSLDEAFERIKTSTKQYAKRQMTWFRHDKRINWIDGDNVSVSKMADKAIEIFNKEIQVEN